MALRLLQIDPRGEREAVEAELCKRSFARFVRRAWRECDPAPLVWGWHLDALCEHLQAVAEGYVDKLIVNIPPGHAKSMIVSVLWPAWRWARDATWRVLTSSYEIGLATRDAGKARTLIEGAWFQRHFTADKDSLTGHWEMQGDQNVKSYYANTSMGFRLCLSVGGKGTGYRGDALVIDDPLNALEAYSKLAREKAIRWKTETMSSRFNDQLYAEEVLIMQRLHEDDLTGYLLQHGGWEHLCLMSEFVPKRRSVTRRRTVAINRKALLLEASEYENAVSEAERTGAPTPPPRAEIKSVWREGWRDPRKAPGDLLFPAKFPKAVLDKAKTPQGMGAIAYEGQHQQLPMPASGGMVQRAWLGRRWHLHGDSSPVYAHEVHGLARRVYDPRCVKVQQRFIVTDAAFKKAEDNDLVAIGVFDVLLPDIYLIDFKWDHLGFLETLNEILAMRKKWTIPGWASVGRVCIEDKANGPALIEVAKQKVPGIIAVEPLGSKEARVAAAAPFMHSGNVWLPEMHPQVEDAVAEASSFPKATHDDWIDMLAYGVLLGLASSDLARLEGLVKW